jgi:helicase MOV-10
MTSRSSTSNNVVVPRRSKAIPILTPHNHQQSSVQVGPLNSKPSISPKQSDIQNGDDADQQEDVSLESEETIEAIQFKRQINRKDAVKNEDEISLDVYARPYVPLALRILNELPAKIQTSQIHATVDFDAYIKTFSGSGFIHSSPDLATRHATILSFDASQMGHLDPIITQDNIATQYTLLFECLLAIEAMKHREEYKLYNMYDITPTPYGNNKHLVFKVPGLREDTPFVRRGDIVHLRPLSYQNSASRLRTMDHWLQVVQRRGIHLSSPLHELADRIVKGGLEVAPGYSGTQWNCSVFNVQKRTEQIVFDKLPFPPDQHFNITFPVQQNRYRDMLQAVSLLGADLPSDPTVTDDGGIERSWAESMLFPSVDDGIVQKTLDPARKTALTWFDNALNHEQKRSVNSICMMNYGAVPFLISGPPGTGKTKTLVETILQLIKNVKYINHILVCTPSDPSADVVADRLSSHLNQEELIRLCSPSRTTAEVPTKLHNYSNMDGDTFVLPEFRRMMRYKVVVTTCLDASMLLKAKLTNSDLFHIEHDFMSSLHPLSNIPPVHLHWNALLIDEAGQATEPMAAIPLAVVAPPKTDMRISGKPLFAMAGDEHQLGPHTFSLHPKLRKSLFSRLFARSLYANHPLSRGTMFTRAILPMTRPPFMNLISNYRSHPAILAVPSFLFYGDSLMDKALDSNKLLGLPIWQGNKWPVLFSPNKGLDELELEGAGWYNASEIDIALAYAIRILQTKAVREDEITVMSPFAAQVRLLRKRFQNRKLWAVNIGPCEAFQGLENRVIILCTTRARKKFLKRDVELCRGLVHQRNRMNVCLTRAKQALIVIGNPDLLSEDPHWVQFLGFCARNGLYDSKELTIDQSSLASLPRMERVLLGQKAQAEDSTQGEKLLGAGVTAEGDEMWETLYTNPEDDSWDITSESGSKSTHVVPVYGSDAFPQYAAHPPASRMPWENSDLRSELDEIHERSLIPKELLN